MNLKDKILKGELRSSDASIPVEIRYASQFSVFVIIPDPYEIYDGKRFNKLFIEINDKSFELGESRFSLETDMEGNTGRLLFLNDVYNFDILFAKAELVNLEKLSGNLGLILSQKEKVKDFFLKYISDIAYDLKVYKHFFDEIESAYEKEPDHVKEAVSQAVLNSEGRKFMAFFDSRVKELEEYIKGFTKEEHEIHGFYLRKQLWDIIACTEFMYRVNVKPRGYAGDSEMMRMIYENAFRGDSIFSKTLYKYSVEHPAAQAVRNRRVMVPRILHDYQKEYSGHDFKFMSVACGPAYELQDLYLTESDASFFHCTLLDQDPAALREAFQNIQGLEKQLGVKIKAKYIRDSVRTMIFSGNLAKEWGRFNFIYSMGLFDYLTPPVARAVIEKIYGLLEPGGRLLIGNYHLNNQSKWFMEYWLDWVLYYRSEQDFIDLLKNTDAEDAEVFFEDTNSQMFLTARKRL